MIDARRIHEGVEVMVDVAVVGKNETLYFSVKHTKVILGYDFVVDLVYQFLFSFSLMSGFGHHHH